MGSFGKAAWLRFWRFFVLFWVFGGVGCEVKQNPDKPGIFAKGGAVKESPGNDDASPKKTPEDGCQGLTQPMVTNGEWEASLKKDGMTTHAGEFFSSLSTPSDLSPALEFVDPDSIVFLLEHAIASKGLYNSVVLAFELEIIDDLFIALFSDPEAIEQFSTSGVTQPLFAKLQQSSRYEEVEAEISRTIDYILGRDDLLGILLDVVGEVGIQEIFGLLRNLLPALASGPTPRDEDITKAFIQLVQAGTQNEALKEPLGILAENIKVIGDQREAGDANWDRTYMAIQHRVSVSDIQISVIEAKFPEEAQGALNAFYSLNYGGVGKTRMRLVELESSLDKGKAGHKDYCQWSFFNAISYSGFDQKHEASLKDPVPLAPLLGISRDFVTDFAKNSPKKYENSVQFSLGDGSSKTTALKAWVSVDEASSHDCWQGDAEIYLKVRFQADQEALWRQVNAPTSLIYSLVFDDKGRGQPKGLMALYPEGVERCFQL